MYVEIHVCVCYLYTQVCICICKYMIVYLWICIQMCVFVWAGAGGVQVYACTHVCSAFSEWVTHTVRWHLWGCYDVCGDSGEGK